MIIHCTNTERKEGKTMMDCDSEPCRACGEHLVIYHQYIGGACCEGCGEWQHEVDTDTE